MTKDVTDLISDRAKNRKQVFFVPEGIKNTHPNPISLAGGKPFHALYPLRSLTYEIAEEPLGDETVAFTPRQEGDKLLLKDALNYGPNDGWKQVKNFSKDLISYVNPPGYSNWDVIMTIGTVDSLHKCFNLLLNPGDVVLMESYTYVPVINCLSAYGGVPVPVEIDFAKGGIDVDLLESQLANWDKTHPGQKIKALYTISTGHNPLAVSLPEESRKRIYELAKKYDFIILEDDPYGYIQLGKYTDGVENEFVTKKYTPESFVKEKLPNSYIQFDEEGRVLRLETFSKVFAPGTRLGFIAGHKDLIKCIEQHSNASTRAPSGLAQVVVMSVIEQMGGRVEDWINWFIKLSKVYTDRKNFALKNLYESSAYKKKYFQIQEPDAGMFISMNLNFPESEDYSKDLSDFNQVCLKNGIIVVLGNKMTVFEQHKKKAKFIRITIASAENDDELSEAGLRLSKAFEEYFGA